MKNTAAPSPIVDAPTPQACGGAASPSDWIDWSLCGEAKVVAEPPELFQLKCLSHASGAVTHLNRNNPSVPQI
jgi:hypothetical protein